MSVANKTDARLGFQRAYLPSIERAFSLRKIAFLNTNIILQINLRTSPRHGFMRMVFFRETLVKISAFFRETILEGGSQGGKIF